MAMKLKKIKKILLHGSNKHSLDLLSQIMNMNQGQYLDQKAHPKKFCVGVGCYPEKHVEAPNMQVSDNLLLEKQKAGTSYAVSQMFYNNKMFLDFIERTRSQLTIPVIPALKIIVNPNQLISIPKNFFIEIPQDLVERMRSTTTKEEGAEVGIDWAFQQSVELIENGHNHLHFYIMRNTQYLLEVFNRLNEKYQFTD